MVLHSALAYLFVQAYIFAQAPMHAAILEHVVAHSGAARSAVRCWQHNCGFTLDRTSTCVRAPVGEEEAKGVEGDKRGRLSLCVRVHVHVDSRVLACFVFVRV